MYEGGLIVTMLENPDMQVMTGLLIALVVGFIYCRMKDIDIF
jgi:hypothetical protein